MNEMNAHVLKKSVVLSLMGATGAALLSACAYNPAIDPQSPLAGRVDELVQANRAYPRLEDFPALPEGLPAPETVKAHVGALHQTRAELGTAVASVDWQLDENAEAFAADVRRQIDSAQVEAPTADTPAEIEAFALSLRDRAKAPPPVDRPL